MKNEGRLKDSHDDDAGKTSRTREAMRTPGAGNQTQETMRLEVVMMMMMSVGGDGVRAVEDWRERERSR